MKFSMKNPPPCYMGVCIRCGLPGQGPDRMGECIVCYPCLNAEARELLKESEEELRESQANHHDLISIYDDAETKFFRKTEKNDSLTLVIIISFAFGLTLGLIL